MYPPKLNGRSFISPIELGLQPKGAELSQQACNTLGQGMLSSVLSYLNRQGLGADIEYKDRWLMPVVFFGLWSYDLHQHYK